MKILKSFYLLLSLVVLAPFAACSDDDNDSRFETLEVAPELLADGIAMEPQGGTTTFQVKASTPIQVSVTSDDKDDCLLYTSDAADE